MTNLELQDRLEVAQNYDIFFNRLFQYGVTLPDNLAVSLKQGIEKTQALGLTDPHALWLEVRQEERVKGTMAVNFDHAGKIIEFSIWLPIKGKQYEMVTIVSESDGSVMGYVEKWLGADLNTSRRIGNAEETEEFLREVNDRLKDLGETQRVSLRHRVTVDRIVEEVAEQKDEDGRVLRRRFQRRIKKPGTEIIDLSD